MVDNGDNIRQTYLALRLAMVLLVGLLFLSVALQVLGSAPDCLQHSLSAYYYTPARPVFIGSLCAIGACLIIYRGNTDTENVLLDYSGFLAFVVAFVPADIDTTCEPTNIPTDAELAAAVRNNVTAALVVGFAAVLLALTLRRLRPDPDGPLGRSAKVSIACTLVVLIAGTAFFATQPEPFREIGHTASAVLLFTGIIGVVVVNAIGFARAHGRADARGVGTNRYFLVAVAMALTLVGSLVAALTGFGHWVFFLEAALIAEFAVFWIIQTVELGGSVSRAETPAAGARPRHADPRRSGAAPD